MRRVTINSQRGFTLIELLVAMTVFSFMLMIVLVGTINVVHLHNQALAANATEDNARTAMNELVRAVRDSRGVLATTAGPLGTLCLSESTQPSGYYVNAGVLKRSVGCGPPSAADQAITNTAVNVTLFEAKVESSGVGITKPAVSLKVRVASNNGTNDGITCNNNNADRNFCSVTTLTSGAVSR